jgi:hypothetical protein
MSVVYRAQHREVERTEVPNCENCIPPTHTETKTINSYGDVSAPVQLTADQSSLLLQATAAKKP